MTQISRSESSSVKRRKKKLNGAYYHSIYAPLIEIAKYILQIVFLYCFQFIWCMIFVITNEWGSEGKVTERKINRIKALTKMKLWVFRHFRKFTEIIEIDDYLSDLNKRLG